MAEVPTQATVEIGRHGTLYATINVFEGEDLGNGTLVAIEIGRHRR